MKTSYFILVALLFSLVACNYPTSATIERVSPSGKVKVSIEASRITGIEPWRVVMKVKAYDFKEGQLATEISAHYLDDKSVKVDWFEESSADVTFTQTDGTTRVFRLIASAQQLQFAEVPAAK
ncbi:MAG: hypothetical protein KF872_09770 [Chitinophagales bacterium]|nr:hypothetical protein [Chitinophagales bacterium]